MAPHCSGHFHLSGVHFRTLQNNTLFHSFVRQTKTKTSHCLTQQVKLIRIVCKLFNCGDDYPGASWQLIHQIKKLRRIYYRKVFSIFFLKFHLPNSAKQFFIKKLVFAVLKKFIFTFFVSQIKKVNNQNRCFWCWKLHQSLATGKISMYFWHQCFVPLRGSQRDWRSVLARA